MKVFVYDVAAEDGGGLFVLKSFYEEVLHSNLEIQWTFMVSTDALESTENIKIQKHPEIKTSWLSRWKFENQTLPKLIQYEGYAAVISLQNMPVSKSSLPQLVYLHQSLQYCPKRFSLLKSEERGLAVRQKLICGLIKKHIRKAKHVFVQTQWIKNATKEWVGFDDKDITVVPVSFSTDKLPIQPYQGQNSTTFFYPARAEIYKNHQVIIDACRLLSQKGIKDYRVVLTINENMGAYARSITEQAKKLPIKFVGTVNYERIWDYYSRSILLFPSYLETCGLPLLEAKAAGTRVIVSDMPFAHEALDGYPNVEFFKYTDSELLAKLMEKALKSPKYSPYHTQSQKADHSLLQAMLPYLQE